MQAKVKKTLDQLLTDRVDLSLSFIVPLILKLFAVNKYISNIISFILVIKIIFLWKIYTFPCLINILWGVMSTVGRWWI